MGPCHDGMETTYVSANPSLLTLKRVAGMRHVSSGLLLQPALTRRP